MDATPASPVEVVTTRVDALWLGYVFPVDPRWERTLEAAKYAAARALRAGRDPRTGEQLEQVELVDVEIAGLPFEVKGYGGAGLTYLLENDVMQLGIAPTASNGAPVLTARLLASALWATETRVLVEAVRRVADELAADGAELREAVQRVDVCVDFQGWVPSASDFEKFCCPGAPTATVHEESPVEETLEAPRMWKRWNLTGFRFGKGDVVVRLYDKTEEIKSSGKKWMFDVWADNPNGYSPDRPVWRLEVQLRRGFLKEARRIDGRRLESVEETLEALGELWRYVLGHRVRLTLSDRDRLTRSTEHPAWKALRLTDAIDGATAGVPIVRLKQDRITAEELLPKVRGYFAKYGALTGREDLADVAVELAAQVEQLGREREEPFDLLVRQKRGRRAALQAIQADFDARRIETEKRRAALEPPGST